MTPRPDHASRHCAAPGCEVVFYVRDPWPFGEHKAPPKFCSNRCRTAGGPWSFPSNKTAPADRGIYYPSQGATREVQR